MQYEDGIDITDGLSASQIETLRSICNRALARDENGAAAFRIVKKLRCEDELRMEKVLRCRSKMENSFYDRPEVINALAGNRHLQTVVLGY